MSSLANEDRFYDRSLRPGGPRLDHGPDFGHALLRFFLFLFFFVLSSKRTYRSKQLSASSDGHVQLLRSGLFDTLSSVMPSLVDEKRFKHKVLSY